MNFASETCLTTNNVLNSLSSVSLSNYTSKTFSMQFNSLQGKTTFGKNMAVITKLSAESAKIHETGGKLKTRIEEHKNFIHK